LQSRECVQITRYRYRELPCWVPKSLVEWANPLNYAAAGRRSERRPGEQQAAQRLREALLLVQLGLKRAKHVFLLLALEQLLQILELLELELLESLLLLKPVRVLNLLQEEQRGLRVAAVHRGGTISFQKVRWWLVDTRWLKLEIGE
jgi:hypothetical protein